MEMKPKLYIGKCNNGYFARIDGQCLFDDPTLPIGCVPVIVFGL
jgi:hypothetical protein